MNTVRAALVTKSGNPLCDKSHVELSLRVMPPVTDNAAACTPLHDKEVAA